MTRPTFTCSAGWAARLSDGVKALMKKDPDFRIEVYPTRRSAAAPPTLQRRDFSPDELANESLR